MVQLVDWSPPTPEVRGLNEELSFLGIGNKTTLSIKV